MKYKLVTDGEFWAVKKSSWFEEDKCFDLEHTSFDLEQKYFWWSKEDKFFNSCWTKDKAKAQNWVKRFNS